ncbi:HAMP domain-containing methyl-accepting chemotaxis protein [Solibacillus sp. FSL H8-0523]|uniref:methyl-accepting chemotaxis protein n=1 Tax=Solibacillus sp. FSL H8-0523 TaxID=2954511 RepID=UPI003100C710
MKFSISKKLWLSFSISIVLIILINVIGSFALTSVNSKYEVILDRDVERIVHAKNLEIAQKDLATRVLEFVALNKSTARDEIEKEIDKGSTAAKALIELSSDEASLILLEDLKVKTVLLFESNNLIMDLKTKGQDMSSAQLTSMDLNSEVLTIIANIIEVQQQNITDTRAEINAFQSTAFITMLMLTVLAVILALFISTYMSRHISRPVGEVTTALEEIAQGNLAIQPLHIKNKDEIGLMGNSFNKMLEDLRGIVSNVSDSSMQVAANAEELSASSQQSLASSQMVAKSAEDQLAISSEQSNFMDVSITSMEELRTSVDQISGDNEQMLNATNDVKTLINQGATSIQNVVDQMETIHETFVDTTTMMHEMEQHSNRIQNITGLITDIADQTNLLALNAAIEAARAGEHGKGFAVVAEEVRKLAEQSKNSATEIESMVQQIQQTSNEATKTIVTGGTKVNEGMDKTSESLHVFRNIESGIGEVVYRVESVSAAVEEIQAMTGSVTDSVKHVQQLAKQTADTASDTSAATEQQLASTEEISHNAQALSELAESLQQDVNHFKL